MKKKQSKVTITQVVLKESAPFTSLDRNEYTLTSKNLSGQILWNLSFSKDSKFITVSQETQKGLRHFLVPMENVKVIHVNVEEVDEEES